MRDDREKRERRSGGHAVGKMIMIKNENDDYVDDGDKSDDVDDDENDDVDDEDNDEDGDNEDIMMMMTKTMTKR